MRVASVFILLTVMAYFDHASAEATYRCLTKDGRTTYINQLIRDVPCECIAGDECPAVCHNDKCSITISKHTDGHFYIVGVVNGHKVRFLVDTGATLSSINQKTADAFGIYARKSAMSATAGGKVAVSIAENIPIAIAGLPPIKISVSINPSLDDNTALLGQNYLQKFKIAIEGRSMVLSAPTMAYRGR